MKVFAFLIASIFVVQTTTPALCMTSCLWESKSECAMDKADRSSNSSHCGEEKSTSCCSDDQITLSSGKQTSGVNMSAHHDPACNTCRIPCCSAPLCCFYFQEINELDFSSAAVLISAQLPSNNGTPTIGYRSDCFQPPENI